MTIKLFIVLVTVFALAGFGEALKLPSYFKACSRNDPDISACVLKNGKEALTKLVNKGGDRKYSIPNFKPLLVTELKVDNGGLKINLQDVKLYGIEDAILTNAMIDFKTKREEFEINIPRLEINSNYDVSGRILVLPIRGTGVANFTVPNVKVQFSHDYDLKKDKTGKEHMVTKNPGVVFYKTKGFIYLENLFGNKELSDHMNLVLNENSEEVIGEVGPALAEALGQVVEQIYNGLTGVIPFDELYPAKV